MKTNKSASEDFPDQTARYHPGNTVLCRYDGSITGTWLTGVSLELESESKAACPWKTPSSQDMVQQTRYLEAGVDQESEGR